MRTSGETMGTKERLLEFFERNRGSFFSGEELAGSCAYPERRSGKGSTACGKMDIRLMPFKIRVTVFPPIRIFFLSRESWGI